MMLYQRLRFRLRMLMFGLTVKPVAGGEETPEEKAEREKREAEEREKEQRENNKKPPWGSDDEFDPKRAWELIQNVRSDIDKIKTERDELRDKVKEHEDASKTEQEKLGERATGAEKTAAEARQEAARLRVALKKGLTETQAKRLVGKDEEQLETDADELLASFRSDDEGDPPPRRPRERLRPGAAPGAEPEKTDPASLAAEVPRGW